MSTDPSHAAPTVLPLERCPACGAPTDRARAFAYGPAELVRCGACGLVHATGYADPDEVYVDGYLEGASHFGNDTRPARWQALLVGAARRRMERATALAGGAGTLLDVGCGSGELLEGARDRGWTATGVEPTPASAARAAARGFDVRPTMLAEADLPTGCWDLVAALHVVEHVRDAVGFLGELRERARPGGLVMVEVPNWDSRWRRRLGPRWSSLRPLEHLGHYTPETMAATMRRAGLEPVDVSTTSHVDLRLETFEEGLHNAGLDHRAGRVARLARRRTVHGVPGRYATAPLRVLLRAVHARQARHGQGHVVLAFARRPA